MARITNAMRKVIVDKALAKLRTEKDKALKDIENWDADIIKLWRKKFDIDAGISTIFDIEVVKFRSRLTDLFGLHRGEGEHIRIDIDHFRVSRLYVNLAGRRVTVSFANRDFAFYFKLFDVDSVEDLAKLYPFISFNENDGKPTCVYLFGPTNSYEDMLSLNATHPLVSRLYSLEGKFEALINECEAAEIEAKAILDSVRTTDQLLEVWPEAERFFPTEDDALPVKISFCKDLSANVSTLNKRLGIKA